MNFFIPGFRPKMKRQQSLLGLGFAKKISRIEISEQQSIKNKIIKAVTDAETLVQQMTCNVMIRQMLFQTAGAIKNMTISEKNIMV